MRMHWVDSIRAKYRSKYGVYILGSPHIFFLPHSSRQLPIYKMAVGSLRELLGGPICLSSHKDIRITIEVQSPLQRICAS